MVGFENKVETKFYCAVIKPDFYCGTISSEPDDSLVPDSLQICFDKGKALFDANCKQCHSFSEVVVGPALRQVGKRREREWLRNFIANPGKVIDSGDTAAVRLFNQFNNQYMPNHTFINREEMDCLITYLSF